MTSDLERQRTPWWLWLAAVALFASSLVAARRVLPEWRAPRYPPAAVLLEKFAQAVRRAGWTLSGPTTHARLAADDQMVKEAYRQLGARASEWLTDSGRSLQVAVETPAGLDGGKPGLLLADLSADGEVWQVQRTPLSWFGPLEVQSAEVGDLRRAAVALCRRPGETLGKEAPLATANATLTAMPIVGADPPQRVQVLDFPGPGVIAMRLPGSIEQARRENAELPWGQIFWQTVPGLLLVLGTLVLTIALALRRYLGFANGAALALIAALASYHEPIDALRSSWVNGLTSGGAWLGRVVLLWLLWSAAESWLRSTWPGFSTSLDALRAGRLGRRLGNSLLGGWASGLAVAGIGLWTSVVAVAVLGLKPAGLSVGVKGLGMEAALLRGPLAAGCVAVGLAAAMRVLPRAWAPLGATAVAAFFLAPTFPLASGLAAFAATLIGVGVLVAVYQRFGLTALLAAAIIGRAAPQLVFALGQPHWLGGMALSSGLVTGGLLALGLVAARRAPQVGRERVGLPGFVLRLEDERRLRYEMDLLARMQIGLLPRSCPLLPGWEVAARSLPASEAGGDFYDFLRDERGRLWIAAGDVSGHGFSCAIAQAMSKAALASLIWEEATPAAVLAEVDRVLRTPGDYLHTFVTLALLRLDPESGEALLANAGHPYPLLWHDSRVAELAHSGLPLGHGPARRYEDHPLRLLPGDALVLLSDGLPEALSPAEAALGFERPAAVVAHAGGGTAEGILNELLGEWRAHLAGAAPLDDTTVVVVKRYAAASAAG
ncbi:MAG: PP2C family protein-serine/threonine phosphatase [Acidobacteriota bacterium]